jgi:hypothetical protein
MVPVNPGMMQALMAKIGGGAGAASAGGAGGGAGAGGLSGILKMFGGGGGMGGGNKTTSYETPKVIDPSRMGAYVPLAKTEQGGSSPMGAPNAPTPVAKPGGALEARQGLSGGQQDFLQKIFQALGR